MRRELLIAFAALTASTIAHADCAVTFPPSGPGARPQSTLITAKYFERARREASAVCGQAHLNPTITVIGLGFSAWGGYAETAKYFASAARGCRPGVNCAAVRACNSSVESAYASYDMRTCAAKTGLSASETKLLDFMLHYAADSWQAELRNRDWCIQKPYNRTLLALGRGKVRDSEVLAKMAANCAQARRDAIDQLKRTLKIGFTNPEPRSAPPIAQEQGTSAGN